MSLSTNIDHGDAASRADLTKLLAYVAAEGRVCPMPRRWDELWQMLPDRRQIGGVWKPLPPLILAAWWYSTAEDKRERLASHLRYAADHGVLNEVEQYLRGLAPEDWAYGDGT
jgi:hypothetical protein